METPFLDLRVFKEKQFVISTMVGSMVFMMMIGVEMVLPMYIQNIRGEDAFHSGLTLLPGALLIGIMMPIAGGLYDKYGAHRLAITGLTIATCGTLPLIFLTTKTPMMFLVVIYAVRMFGISMVMMPVTTSGMNYLPVNKISHGSAANNTVRQVMGSIGTAILVSVLSNVTTHSMPSASLMKELPFLFKQEAMQATLNGYHVAFLVSCFFGIVGFILAFFVRDKKEQKGAKHNG